MLCDLVIARYGYKLLISSLDWNKAFSSSMSEVGFWLFAWFIPISNVFVLLINSFILFLNFSASNIFK
ncbi:hypothetical protein [Mycoplasmopsis felis]|uniref:hypothetical protein n=1 Tax=Mycoplasmopsis felis TaxID=33923 RepID=UPI0021AF9977|nr:hypothetical protein [Mycoplasmopsis felis]MCU9932324.1 hypothetical protein [Mycoplasmopsis felis]UWV83504.1 hypothetical protein NWE58_04105 [Mycoplasmopsis felis]UWW01168.1 hypothetical protein NW064_02020 [Mycoplasmopsis felis]